jgi:hypothetical protein
MSYELKYLKYKNKYLSLKNMVGYGAAKKPKVSKDQLIALGISKQIAGKIKEFESAYEKDEISGLIQFYDRLLGFEGKRKEIAVYLINKFTDMTASKDKDIRIAARNINRLVQFIAYMNRFDEIFIIEKIDETDSGILYLIAEYKYKIKKDSSITMEERDSIYKKALKDTLVRFKFNVGLQFTDEQAEQIVNTFTKKKNPEYSLDITSVIMDAINLYMEKSHIENQTERFESVYTELKEKHKDKMVPSSANL